MELLSHQSTRRKRRERERGRTSVFLSVRKSLYLKKYSSTMIVYRLLVLFGSIINNSRRERKENDDTKQNDLLLLVDVVCLFVHRRRYDVWMNLSQEKEKHIYIIRKQRFVVYLVFFVSHMYRLFILERNIWIDDCFKKKQYEFDRIN